MRNILVSDWARLTLAFTALMLSFVIPHSVWAQATLENPAPGSFQSSIGLVSGWKCTAGTLTFTIDNGPPAQLVYGSSRLDTQSVCGHRVASSITTCSSVRSARIIRATLWFKGMRSRLLQGLFFTT